MGDDSVEKKIDEHSSNSSKRVVKAFTVESLSSCFRSSPGGLETISCNCRW